MKSPQGTTPEDAHMHEYRYIGKKAGKETQGRVKEHLVIDNEKKCKAIYWRATCAPTKEGVDKGGQSQPPRGEARGGRRSIP